MEGQEDHRAAAIEPQANVGVIGRVHKKPVGADTGRKRRADHFELCRVRVSAVEVRQQLPERREKGQRRGAGLLPNEADDLVDDPGLIEITRNMPTLS